MPQKHINLSRERAVKKWDKRYRGKKIFCLHNTHVEGFQMCNEEAH